MTTEKAVKEEKTLQDYELAIIVSPKIEGEALETTVGNINKFITERGGVISQTDQWGKKKLAYPIKHFLEGHYVLFKFKMEPTLNKALEANLKISEEIIRYMLIKLETQTPSPKAEGKEVVG